MGVYVTGDFEVCKMRVKSTGGYPVQRSPIRSMKPTARQSGRNVFLETRGPQRFEFLDRRTKVPGYVTSWQQNLIALSAAARLCPLGGGAAGARSGSRRGRPGRAGSPGCSRPLLIRSSGSRSRRITLRSSPSATTLSRGSNPLLPIAQARPCSAGTSYVGAPYSRRRPTAAPPTWEYKRWCSTCHQNFYQNN